MKIWMRTGGTSILWEIPDSSSPKWWWNISAIRNWPALGSIKLSPKTHCAGYHLFADPGLDMSWATRLNSSVQRAWQRGLFAFSEVALMFHFQVLNATSRDVMGSLAQLLTRYNHHSLLNCCLRHISPTCLTVTASPIAPILAWIKIYCIYDSCWEMKLRLANRILNHTPSCRVQCKLRN